mgnify:CR=1 FL=1
MHDVLRLGLVLGLWFDVKVKVKVKVKINILFWCGVFVHFLSLAIMFFCYLYWLQLDAYEKAVSVLAMDPQHRQQHDEDDASERHNQFIVAIRSQIASIENDLLRSKDTMDLRVHSVISLNQDEKDDLARFLCGPRQYLETDIASSRNRTRSETFSSLRETDASRPHSRYNNDDFAMCYGRSGSGKAVVATDPLQIRNGLCDQLPIPHSASERLLRDEDCSEDNLFKERLSGHLRSMSLGDDWNNCKNGYLLASSEKPSRISENTWCLFSKTKTGSKSGLKRFKDGDATETDQQQIPYIILGTNDCEKVLCLHTFCLFSPRFPCKWKFILFLLFSLQGYCKSEESVPGYISNDVKRYMAFTETFQSFQFLSRPRMRIASFVLAACGLLGWF